MTFGVIGQRDEAVVQHDDLPRVNSRAELIELLLVEVGLEHAVEPLSLRTQQLSAHVGLHTLVWVWTEDGELIERLIEQHLPSCHRPTSSFVL
jgi:hypothetical protein